MQKQLEDMKSYAIQNFCKDLLEISDNLDLALESSKKKTEENVGIESTSLYKGLQITRDSLQKAFAKHGLVQTIPKGEVFDPKKHDAVYEISSDSAKPGDVVELLPIILWCRNEALSLGSTTHIRTFSKMKRHQESSDHSQSFGKRRRNESFSSAKVELAPGTVELRFLLTNKEAGAVIGTRGDYIKSIRDKYDANLLIKDKSTSERMLIIKLNDVFFAFYGIEIHLSHSGAIIGHGGSRINELRQKSELHIKVFRQCCPGSTDRIIRLMGLQDRICEVIESLVYFMEQNPIEGPQRKYDVANCNPDAAAEYGGFAEEDRSSPSLRSRGSRSDNPVRSFAEVLPGVLMSETVSEQFSIPDDLGGVVIGERGSRIKCARQESGAQIQVSSANADGDRIITQSIRSSEFGRQYLQNG
uniref:K Homology domain-containing protein n=1 Tax=Ditylenchus dipsaci TaxID=166011 RepID=A0A915DXS8_9BILA